MELKSYLNPVDVESLVPLESPEDPHLLYNYIEIWQDGEPVLDEQQFAIIGVPESRNAFNNADCSLAPDAIRRSLYQLYSWEKNVNIIDFGNLILGETIEDSYEVLAEILATLINDGITPIILGGSNDIAFANYKAYEILQKVISIVSVDARFDLGKEDEPLKSNAYLNKIILQQPNFLLNYSNIGYQTYMNSPEAIEMMEKLYFESYRVGMLRQDVSEVEPIVRNAEMVSLDISSIRHPDAPGNPNSSANGFYGEEICQVAMYAGLSDKLSSFGIYEYDPMLDYNGQTAQLISHIIWYFIEGSLNRYNDLDFKDRNNYYRYSITVSENSEEMEFFCSKKSGRWWVSVPVINVEKKTQQTYYLPCSKNDYDTACSDTIPDRWWKAYNKFNH
ncbi:MAG: formimidoylglutamase [Bacteroidales bacterium]|nr:formimidoylglutamase [Bacteroidales bacterium]